MISMLLFFARDTSAFPLSQLTRKASYTAIVNRVGPFDHNVHQQFCLDDGSLVKLWLYPTSTAVARSCWSCNTSSSLSTTNDQSVLAISDTLPNFSTAHGLLSPNVVKRIADSKDLELNGPLVKKFVDTYVTRGPMACLFMLSDPKILPELTKAMRAVM